MHELAEQYGVRRTNVSRCLRNLAVPLRRQGLDPEQVAEAAKLYGGGWWLTRLGERYGCAHTTVRVALLQAGVVPRRRPGWNYGGSPPNL